MTNTTWIDQSQIFDFPSLLGFAKSKLAESVRLKAGEYGLNSKPKNVKPVTLSNKKLNILNEMRLMVAKVTTEQAFIELIGVTRDLLEDSPLAQQIITEVVSNYSDTSGNVGRGFLVNLFNRHKVNKSVKPAERVLYGYLSTTNFSRDDKESNQVNKKKRATFTPAKVFKGFDAKRVVKCIGKRTLATSVHSDVEDAVSLSFREVMKAISL